MLQAYGNNIWACRTPLKVAGMDMSTQMSVVRLPDQQLILISPVEITDTLKQAINALGTVSTIISPNNFHHLFANKALQAFPDASYFCPPGLPPRIKTLPPAKILHEIDNSFWQGQLDSIAVSQSHLADEVVFFHTESKTLIVTDLLQSMEGKLSLPASLFAFITGTRNKPSVSRLYRLLGKDKDAMRLSFEKILEWDFNTVLMAHNSNQSENAYQKVKEALMNF